MGTSNRGNLKHEEASQAAWEAGKGGLIGAAKWGVPAAALGAVAHRLYPLYRGLTIQFKVYIQMSVMIMGGWIAAENRLRMYENGRAHQRRMLQNQVRQEMYEQEIRDSNKGK